MAIFDALFAPLFFGIIFIAPLPLYLLVEKLKLYKSEKQCNLYFGLGLVLIGVAIMFLGFWNADFAFNYMEFRRGDVTVPFIGVFAPGELWNLSWFLIFCGAFYSVYGGLNIGLSHSK